MLVQALLVVERKSMIRLLRDYGSRSVQTEFSTVEWELFIVLNRCFWLFHDAGTVCSGLLSTVFIQLERSSLSIRRSTYDNSTIKCISLSRWQTFHMCGRIRLERVSDSISTNQTIILGVGIECLSRSWAAVSMQLIPRSLYIMVYGKLIKSRIDSTSSMEMGVAQWIQLIVLWLLFIRALLACLKNHHNDCVWRANQSSGFLIWSCISIVTRILVALTYKFMALSLFLL